MTKISEIYKDVIIEQNRFPKNFGILECPTHVEDGYNTLCGDRIKIFFISDGSCIERISFNGDGCAISIASASIMTESVFGKSFAYIIKLFKGFHDMLVLGNEPSLCIPEDFLAFKSLYDHPSRVKCATLCWHTMLSGMNKLILKGI